MPGLAKIYEEDKKIAEVHCNIEKNVGYLTLDRGEADLIGKVNLTLHLSDGRCFKFFVSNQRLLSGGEANYIISLQEKVR